MSTYRGVALGAVLAVAVASTARTTPQDARMFPAFTMFRGGSLEKPLLMHHANVTTDTIRGVVVANLGNDPLAMLYRSLVATSPVSLGDPDIVVTYEVAEFFGPKWRALAGPDGRPTRPLEFEEANHFSKMHVMRSRAPVWMHPVVAPGGGNYSALSVSDTAQAILANLGMTFR